MKSKKGQTSGTRKSLREKTPNSCSTTVERLKMPMTELLETIMEEEEDVVEVAPFSQLPTYVAPRKPLVRVPKDLDKI